MVEGGHGGDAIVARDAPRVHVILRSQEKFHLKHLTYRAENVNPVCFLSLHFLLL